MKKIFVASICLFISVTIAAQSKLYIHKTDKMSLGAYINVTDSIYFNKDRTSTYFKIGDTIPTYLITTIDSITFGNNLDTIYVKYEGTSVSVINPLAFEGVSVTVSGADVVVRSAIADREIYCNLSGTTTNGMFKMYNNYRYNLILNGVNITNTDGPAINMQSGKKCRVTLMAGKTNSLIDGVAYASAPLNNLGVAEDQKSTLFSEGQLEFEGTGSLTVKSNSKHAICSDDFISVLNGNITVSGASKDGINSNEHFSMNGGTLTITATGDGIDCGGYVSITGGSITTTNATADTKGISADSIMTITGGTINLTMNGNQSKGLKSTQNMSLNGGTITINTAGAAVLTALGSGYDPSYCSAIKCDSTITINGAKITIKATGIGGKGISANKNITMLSGTVDINTSGNGATYTNSLGITEAYAASCIDADGNVTLTGGSITTYSSGTGGKGITTNGNLKFGSASSNPTINVTTIGTRITVSGTGAAAIYADPKAIKSDGVLTINNGTFTINTSQPGGNGIDSDSTLIIAGGTLNLTIGGNQTKGITADRLITLSGGTITLKMSGSVILEASGSGNDPSYCTAIKGNADVTVSGSTITITSTGAAGKGIAAVTNFNMTGGSLNITTSGTGTTYKNITNTTDSYSASSISCDGNVSITGGTLTTISSGAGGKGLSVDGTTIIGSANASPTINITTTGAKFLVSGTDYCHPKAIRSTGAITINNGTTTVTSSDDGMHSDESITQNNGNFTVTTSVEGIESKIITINGGTMNVTSSNDGINVTYSTKSGGTDTNDDSHLYIKGGTVTASCTNGDAVDSNGNITMTGGILVANGPQSGVEEAVDFNGTFNMNGGLCIGGGSTSFMTKAMNTTSTQRNLFLTTTTLVASSSLLHIQNATGTDIITFKPEYGSYKFLFSSSALSTGVTYSLYTGGSYTGGTSTKGYLTGGTYSTSNASLKKTFTLSTTSTVNNITF